MPPGPPTTPLAVSALDLATRHEHPAIRDHSLRVHRYAVRIARHRGIDEYPDDLLFAACVLHDIGTADAYDDPVRFEVAGADAAARFLTERGVPADGVDQVWQAIALHTSPQIAERRGVLPLLTRLGVLADFGADDVGVGPADRAAVEAEYPRQDVERVLAAAVVAQARRNPAKAPAWTWPAGLVAKGADDAF